MTQGRPVLYIILLINSVHFIGLGYSPTGFYMDEAAGATQVLCIAQTGFDFYGKHLPLFSRGASNGIYTPAYLYGQIAWTSIFGNSIVSFRSFSAFVTTLTILILYLWARKKAGSQTAMYVALAASIMPWAFQFSRIAWDPPLAVLFLISALWASSLEKYNWIAGLFLALAVYSYTPMRITAILFWLLIPGVSLKSKAQGIVIALFLCIPLFNQTADPEFMARSTSLAIWSNSSSYNHGPIDLPYVFAKQMAKHFTPSFLFIRGDSNIRHSIQSFGMLSWLDLMAIISGIFIYSRKVVLKMKNDFFTHSQRDIFTIALIGITAGVIPAALTNEGIPHALRSISAWPFFALLTGLLLKRLEEEISSRWTLGVSLCVGLGFFCLYQYSYFVDYPALSQEGFQISDQYGNEPAIARAYFRITQEGLACNSEYLPATSLSEESFNSRR